MEKIKNAFTSKRVWTIIVLFVLNGIDGVRESIGQNFLEWANPVLTLAGIYFGAKTK